MPRKHIHVIWLISVGLAVMVTVLALTRPFHHQHDPHLLQTFDVQEPVSAVALSHDATLVAAGSFYGTIKVWRVNDGTLLQMWHTHPHPVEALAFTDDNRLLMSGVQDGTVIGWDMETGEQHYSLPPITVSPQNSYTASDGRERFLTRGILAIAVHPQEDILAAAGGWQGQLLLFHPHTGQILHSWQGHPLASTSGRYDTITALVFHPTDAYLASGTSRGQVSIWDRNGNSSLALEKVPATHVQSLRFAPHDQELQAIFEYPTIARWSAQNGDILTSMRITTPDMPAAILSSNGKFFVRGGPTYHQDFFKGFPILGPEADTHIYIEDIQTGTHLLTLSGHTDVVRALALSRDNRTLVSGSEDGTVRLWRVPEFEE
jgi:WD40 repeat protein